MSVQTTVTKQPRDLMYVHLAVIVIFMFCFGYLPPIGSITPVGMKLLGIFVGLLYGWSTCGMLWPSLMGMFAMGFSGVGTVKQMLAMGFSNEMFIFLIFMLILVQMLSDSGAVNGVVNFIISRKSLQGKPWLFSFVFLLAAGILSTFAQAFAAYLLCWGILETLFRKVGYKPYDAYPTIMLIGVVISSAAIGMMIPFKGTPLLLLGAYSGLTKVTVNYFQFMLVMIPAGLCCLVGYLLICKLVIRPDVSLMKNINVEELMSKDEKFTKRQKASLIAFGMVLLLLLIPGSFPATWPVIAWLNKIGLAGTAVACTIIYCLIRVDGAPLLDFTKQARGGMNWSIVFMVAVLMMMTSLLMSDATGIKPFVIAAMQPILNHCSGLTLLLLLFVIGVILTNFMNNMVVGFILIPILVALSGTMTVNVTAGVLMILVAVNAAYLTPAASPAAAMLFEKKDWLHGGDIVKVGFLAIFVLMIVGVTVVLGFGSVIF